MSEVMRNIYAEFTKDWQNSHMLIFEKFRAFWDNDYEEIQRYIKEAYTDKPFAKDPFDNFKTGLDFMVIIHHDIIQTIIDQLTAGIYDDPPIREISIMDGDQRKDSQDEGLTHALEISEFNEAMKESLRKALFYNIVLYHPIYRDETIDSEIISPDYFMIQTQNSYLRMSKLLIERTDLEGKPYMVYWDKDKHYIIGSDDNPEPESKENNYNKNLYKVLPATELRINKGMDFYGEPNWNILINQMSIDLKLTDMDNSEILMRNGFLHGINTDIEGKKRIAPGILVQSRNDDPKKQISLEWKTPNLNFMDHREGIDWRIVSMMRSMGIVGSSASTDILQASGISKSIDRASLEEKRKNNILMMSRFEKRALNLLKVVYNYRVKSGELGKVKAIPENSKFIVKYQDQKIQQTVTDQIAREEADLRYGIRDVVDFVMERYDLSEPEAIEFLKKKQERKSANAELFSALEEKQKDDKALQQDRINKILSQDQSQ